MSGRVFVTGGAGYIGSHTCKALARAGWEVVVYDDLSRGWRDFVRWGPLIEGSILDVPRLPSIIQGLTRFCTLQHLPTSLRVSSSRKSIIVTTFVEP